MSWTFPLFRLFGIQVRVHWTLAILMAGMLVQGYFTNSLKWRAVTLGILFVSVLFHEYSHCWMARRRGGHAEEILLWPLGGMAYVGHSGSPRDELKVAGIGPISSFVFGGICLGFLFGSGARWDWEYVNPFETWWFPPPMNDTQNYLIHGFRLNMYLGLFNLVIPAYPLDGGRVLFAFLTLRHGRRRAAELISMIAIPIGVALAIWGVAKNEVLLILIGAWVLIESFQLRWLIKVGELEAHQGFGQISEFEYAPERPRRKGWFARWRERRVARREARRLAEDVMLRERVDLVLEKVTREGIGSLSPEERRILEEASRRSRSGGVR